MKHYFTYFCCLLSLVVSAQDNKSIKNEARDVVRNFYALMENITDEMTTYEEKKAFKISAINSYCDRIKTRFVNNFNTDGFRDYSASEYLDNLISFFPYGAKFRLKILTVSDPSLMENMDKLHCVVKVKSEVENLETHLKFSTYMDYNIIFKQVGIGTYGEAIIESSELSERRVPFEKDEEEKTIEPISNSTKENIGEEIDIPGIGKPLLASMSDELDYEVLDDSKFRRCKGGHFIIGCQTGSINCEQDEKPAASVKIRPFDIQVHEVTNKQYLDFITTYGADKVKKGAYRGKTMLYPSSQGLQKQGDQWSCTAQNLYKPVVNVTWYGAITFANFYGLDLPTEAQWEYAARSGNVSSTFQFSGTDHLEHYGFFESNSNNETNRIMQKMPNGLNLFDMSGNVWEWCKEWYKENAYRNYPKIQKLEKGDLKSVRGGGYSNTERECRVQNRWFKAPDLWANDIGFRCVKNY